MGKKIPENSKKAAGQAKKQEAAEAKKQKESAKKSQEEDLEWQKGAKSNDKQAQEEMKKAEVLRKKKEKEELQRLEDLELEAIKKKASKQKDLKESKINSYQAAIDQFSASGIDSALDMLEIVQTDASLKSSDKIERHPERRVKSAWRAFEEREMPLLKAENPKLRLSQLNQMLQKKWDKSPENPMNQQSISHTTSRQEEREMIEKQKQKKLESFKSN